MKLRAQPKPSSTDDYARLIARAVAKGRLPPFSDDLDRYCEAPPREIFAAFAGAARHMPPAGKDEALGIGYLFLLQRLLEHLRYRTDRGYADAAKLIADFQADVVTRVEAGQVDARMLAFVGGALHQSKIPASPELAAVSARYPNNEDEGGPLPTNVGAALGGILEACGGDPFMVVGSLIESSHAMPVETRSSLAGAMALAGMPEARAAAVLFLLDPDSAVRRAVVGALDQVAAALTPTDIRRLIAMRNWRPEDERAEVDAVIRKARAAGIDWCAVAGGRHRSSCRFSHRRLHNTRFPAVSPAGRKKRISSVLTKSGIADAWSSEPGSRSPDRGELGRRGDERPMLAVSTISTAPWRMIWRSAQRSEKPRRLAYFRLPRRSAVLTGNPRE